METEARLIKLKPNSGAYLRMWRDTFLASQHAIDSYHMEMMTKMVNAQTEAVSRLDLSNYHDRSWPSHASGRWLPP